MKILFTDEVVQLIEQSREAFLSDEKLHSYSRQRSIRMLNGEVITDSESDHHPVKESDKDVIIAFLPSRDRFADVVPDDF